MIILLQLFMEALSSLWQTRIGNHGKVGELGQLSGLQNNMEAHHGVKGLENHDPISINSLLIHPYKKALE